MESTTVQLILRKSKNYEYVVSGYHSYIAHIPKNIIQTLDMLLSKEQALYFNNQQEIWYISVPKYDQMLKIINNLKKELVIKQVKYTVEEILEENTFIFKDKNNNTFAIFKNMRAGNPKFKVIKGIYYLNLVEMLGDLTPQLDNDDDKFKYIAFVIEKSNNVVHNKKVNEFIEIIKDKTKTITMTFQL